MGLEYWLLAALIVIGLAGVAILLMSWKKLLRFGASIQFERAKEMFKLQKERLHEKFFDAAAASGKPRGLRWVACEWEPTVEFVRDRKTSQIIAFVGVTLHFEAIEGGDMEDVAAVSLPRNASAVFYFTAGHWYTNGTTIMNQNPDEATERFQHQYERLGSYSS